MILSNEGYFLFQKGITIVERKPLFSLHIDVLIVIIVVIGAFGHALADNQRKKGTIQIMTRKLRKQIAYRSKTSRYRATLTYCLDQIE